MARMRRFVRVQYKRNLPWRGNSIRTVLDRYHEGGPSPISNLEYAFNRPPHENKSSGSSTAECDTGSHRAWTFLCIQALVDLVAEGRDYLDCALLFNRDPIEVLEVINIVEGSPNLVVAGERMLMVGIEVEDYGG